MLYTRIYPKIKTRFLTLLLITIIEIDKTLIYSDIVLFKNCI